MRVASTVEVEATPASMTDTEAHRAACEAREVATWIPELRERFCQAVREKRGHAAALKLMTDVADEIGRRDGKRQGVDAGRTEAAR